MKDKDVKLIEKLLGLGVVMFYVASLVGCGSSQKKVSVNSQDSIKQMNVIYILADDLGYGYVSFLGQP